jgi:methylenetetrahydrofolate reductase (NADPH)
MKIRDILRQRKPTVSFEFFPPKDDKGAAALTETLSQLRDLHPDFTSCTYGAGGSTRAKTLEVTLNIKERFGLDAMAHFTCVGQRRTEIDLILESFARHGIENILALRGDRPVNQPEPPEGWFPDFQNAVHLIRHLREKFGDTFSLGCAGYPEKHPEAPDFQTDLQRLKAKVDAGADFIITQLYFDNAVFFDFVRQARAAGIQVPIIAGIMPVSNVAQTKKFTAMCGATIPAQMLADLEKISEHPEAVQDYGIQWSTRQCRELIEHSVDGLHFYTLNRSRASRQIVESLRATGALN